MIGWGGDRNFNSEETKMLFFNIINHNEHRILHLCLAVVPNPRNGSTILKSEERRVIKLIKPAKGYSYRERLKTLGLTTILEKTMRSDLIETSKYFMNIVKKIDIWVIQVEGEIY